MRKFIITGMLLVLATAAHGQTSSGAGFPSVSCTANILGQTYLDTTNNLSYRCVNISGTGYLWQLGQSPILPVASDPTGVACTGGLPNEQYQGTMFTCKGGVWTASGGTTPQWQRLGVVIAPIAGDPTDSGAGHIQETSAIISTSPEILTNYTKVKKFSFTNGWQPVSAGGSGMSVCFGEAADDVSQPTRFPNCLTNHGRGYMAIDPTNGKYMLSAVNTTNGQLDIYENTTISLLSQMVSPTYTNVLSCGSNGNEQAGSLGAGVPIWDATNSLWRVLYGCVNSAGSNSYADWLATGPTLNALTKASPTPVIGYGSPAAITNCSDCGISQMFYSNGQLIGYANGGPTGVAPTPYMWRFVDSTGIGNAWVADSAPFMQSKTALEGINYSNGQIGQPYLTSTLDGTGTVLYYAAYSNGCPNQATCAYPSYEMAATIPQPLSTVITEQTTDALPIAHTFQVNGVLASCGMFCNFVGTGVTDLGNGSIAFGSTPGTGSYVQGAGQFSASSSGATSLGQSIGTVTAGDLIVSCATWTRYSGTPTYSVSDGTSSFVTTPVKTIVGSPDTSYSQCAYLLSANAGAVTYTASWSGGSASNIEMWVGEFHATAGTWHELSNSGAVSSGATTASSSGTLTVNGTATVAVMDSKLTDVAATTSAPLLFAVTPTEFTFSPINTYDHKYYVLNKSVTTGDGSLTYSTGTYWSNIVMAFGAY